MIVVRPSAEHLARRLDTEEINSISKPVCCEPPAVAPPAGIRIHRCRWLLKTVRTSEMEIIFTCAVETEIRLYRMEASANCSMVIKLASPGPMAATSSFEIPIGG